MNLDKLGYHVNAPLLENVYKDYINGIRTFQIFLSSPQKYVPIDVSVLLVLKQQFHDAEFIIHGPFWASLCKPFSVKAVDNTLAYYSKLSHELSRFGTFKIVTHVGGRGEYSKNESANCLLSFCQRWLFNTRDDSTILCLENDSGSKNDSKMGSVKLLRKIAETCDHPRLRIAFDTEHAYANGFDLADTEKLYSIKPYVSVVHFNAIPENVVRGGHLDRHSKTLLKESKDGWQYLKNVYDVLYDGYVPFIREIDGREMLYEDIQFLQKEGDIIEVLLD